MANEEAKLFVAGLPDSISEDVLKQLFEATGGTVVNVSLPKDRATGRPRGFGFVTLSTPAEAQSARDALDGSMQAGKSISVRPFQAEPPRRDSTGGLPSAAGPRSGAYSSSGPASGGPPSAGPRAGGPGGGPGAPDRTLYVGNLPYDSTPEEVEVLVNNASAGGVVRVHLPTDPDGRKRGFGFVTLASPEAAKTAADGLRQADLRGRRLVVNLAHPKGERPERPAGGGYAGGGGGGYAGGGGGFGGGGGGGYAGGGGGFGGGGYGGPPAFAGGGGGSPAGGPPPGRKPFDDKRRKGSNEDGPRKTAGGRPKREDRNDRIDWTNNDDD